MRLHRFYISPEYFAPKAGVVGQEFHFDQSSQANQSEQAGQSRQSDVPKQSSQSYGRLVHQWRDIFRFGKGDRVLIFNELHGQWLAEFTQLDKKNGAYMTIIEQDIATDGVTATKMKPKQNITLYMAIIKNSNFDLVVEKATELGVSKIVPVKTERTVKSGLNFERLEKLAIEASEQSGRMTIPEITEIMELSDAIVEAQKSKNENKNENEKNAKLDPQKNTQNALYFAHIDDGAQNDKDVVRGIEHDAMTATEGDRAIFIGPEGGWSDSEIELFLREKITPISLGQFVLRAETAAIVGASIMAL